MPLDDDDFDRRCGAEEEERVRRIKAAGRKIVEGFNELRHARGHEQAWRDLSWFLERVKPPRKPKGRHRPHMDEEILAAHHGAPRGKKMAEVCAVGERYGVTPGATIRHLRRLLAQGKRSMAAFMELIESESRLHEVS